MAWNRRSRSLTFRVSQEEYDQLIALFESRAARNLSEFVRSYVLGASGARNSQPDGASAQLRRIEQRLLEIDRTVKSLAARQAQANRTGEPED